jgi:ABC-type nitrate/sulfonate/bicarbonate transport system permease component
MGSAMTGSGGESRLKAILLPAAVMIGIVIVWELVYRVFKVPTFVVPAPFGIIAETWEWRWRLLGHTWVTLYETLAGFALSILVGTPLAVVIVYSPSCAGRSTPCWWWRRPCRRSPSHPSCCFC